MPDPLRIAPLFNRHRVEFHCDKPNAIMKQVWDEFPKYLYLMTYIFFLFLYLTMMAIPEHNDQERYYFLSNFLGGIGIGLSMCPSIFFLYAYIKYSKSDV
jgi:hypothetical protein